MGLYRAAARTVSYTHLDVYKRQGRPIEATTPETIEKIHKIVLANRRVKVSEIAETVGISAECVHNILHTHLSMTKLCARWVLCLLIPDQKQCRKDVSTNCLALYKRNQTEFLC